MKNQMALLFLFFALLLSAQSQKHSIAVEIDGFSSNRGNAVVGLFSTESKFLKEVYKHQSPKVKNGKVKVWFRNVPSGTYAISVYHDENANQKLDTNFMGIPKEDYACSNQAKGFMGPPKWEDAKFILKSNKSLKIKI